MVKWEINGQPAEAAEGQTILQAALEAGVDIPHFCYHPAFPPQGSCRMCLVEIEGSPKLELSCSTGVSQGMKVWTSTPRVVEARREVLELILAEHPLDCPICDKAGDCALQEYYEKYGWFEGRFSEEKSRRSKKVPIGSGLLLDQERCILCTRCVRFLRDVTKTSELGLFERGARTEVGIYENVPVDNNYSGCLAEVCPVGAITDTDFRFKTRAWFLEKKGTLCPFCSRNCPVLIEYHPGFARLPESRRIYRVRARPDPRVNGYWICNLGRYGYSYLETGRQEECLHNVNGRQEACSWGEVRGRLASSLRNAYAKKTNSRVAVILSGWLTNEELFLIHKIFREDLQGARIAFFDPETGEGDSLLLSPERSPNLRGARELGFDPRPPDGDGFLKGLDVLIVFGHFLHRIPSLASFKPLLDAIRLKVLLTTHASELNRHVDCVVACAAWAEKSGSFTNGEGIVQAFSPALLTDEGKLPEWKILVDLGCSLGIRPEYFRSFSSPEAIYSQIGREQPFFRNQP